MSEQSPASTPITEGPADPEHDSTAAYGLDRSYVAGLTGAWSAPAAGPHAVSSPIGHTPLAHVPQSSPADVAEAFGRARAAQVAWSATSLDERSAALLRLHDLLLDRQDELIDLVVWESGKARKDAYLEVAHLALTARYYARTAHEHLDPAASAACSPCSPGPRSTACPRASSASSRPGTTPSPWPSATGSRPCWPATRWSPSPTPRPC